MVAKTLTCSASRGLNIPLCPKPRHGVLFVILHLLQNGICSQRFSARISSAVVLLGKSACPSEAWLYLHFWEKHSPYGCLSPLSAPALGAARGLRL